MAKLATVIGYLVISIMCIAGFAAADDRARMDEPFEISADRIFFDNVRNLYVAEGHVRVDQVGRRLKARWLAFSTETRIGVAEGDVELDDGPDRLQAEFMVFDVDTLHGMLFQGSMDSGGSGFQIRAKELVRTGENTFTVRDGVFTTCRCDPGERLPWEIHSSKAKVEMGGYGTITNSTFNVLGVPVLWVPWAFFPIKSDRETGLLLPSFAFGGRGGANFGLPFFWAALPSLNVTATPHYFVKRGYKQDLEFEYVFGERSGGELFLSGLIDREYQSTVGSKNERWAIIWDHDQELPGKWRWQTDVNLASDNLYSSDFIELRKYNAFRFMESTSNAARDFGASGGLGAMVATRYADDIQGTSLVDRDSFRLQRFAEARGDIQSGALVAPGGIEVRLDSEVMYFSSLRSVRDAVERQTTAPMLNQTDGEFFDVGVGGFFDNASGVGGVGAGDGIFQPGEPLAERGTRVVIHPRLARPFRIGRFAEFVPEIGWQQALYRTSSKQFAERGLLTARADIRGRLARDYFGKGGRATRHIIEPRLGWALVSQRRQRGNPLFIPRPQLAQTRLRALSLENVTRNPSDRIASTNQLVFSIAQRFFVRDWANQAPRLQADLVTGIDWDFAGGEGLGNIYVEGRLFPMRNVSARVRGVFDPEAAVFEEGEVGAGISFPSVAGIFGRTTISGNYRMRRRIPVFAESERGSSPKFGVAGKRLSQLDWSASIELSQRVRFRYTGIYSFADDNGFIRSRGTLDYVSKCRCWGVGVSAFHQREQGFGGGLEIRFLGLGDEGSNLFDGGFGFGQNF